MMRALLFLFVMAFATFAAPPRAEALLCVQFLGCSCSVNASDLNFGDVRPLLNQATTGRSDVSISCTGVIDALPVVYAKVGPGIHGVTANRRMSSGANTLTYNLYNSDQVTRVILGDGTTYPMLAISGGLITLGTWSTTVHIYGEIPATPTARPGSYTDTVTVRIDW